jgi:hypothetical protein
VLLLHATLNSAHLHLVVEATFHLKRQNAVVTIPPMKS